MTVLVDTNIFIDHLRGLPEPLELLDRLRGEGPLRGSTLTRAELRAGSRGDAEPVEALVSTVRWEPVTAEIADLAGAFARRYRASHPSIDLVDYVVAATADALGLELATRNVRHFPMFPELESPY